MKEKTENWIRPIAGGLIISLITWSLSKVWESGNVKKYVIDFFVTFSPVILGLLASFSYRLIIDYRKLRKVSYNHDHTLENIQGLMDKIKVIEKEALSRTESDKALGERINKLEVNVKNLNDEIGLDDPLNPYRDRQRKITLKDSAKFPTR